MDELDYLFIFMAYLVAGFIKGLTGIGFSTSCLPTMAMRLDLKIAIPLVRRSRNRLNLMTALVFSKLAWPVGHSHRYLTNEERA